MSDDAPPPELPEPPPSTPDASPRTTLPSPSGGVPRWVPFAAVAAVVVVVVVLVLVLSGGGNDSKNTAQAGTTGTSGATAPKPVATQAADVVALSQKLGRAIYWAGPAGANTSLELTQSGSDIYLRYLTGGAQPGDPRANFLTVGSYLQPNAKQTIQEALKAPGAERIKLANGAVGVYNKTRRPTSAYLVFADGKQLVEVFSPTAGRAKTLVQSRRIRPVTP